MSKYPKIVRLNRHVHWKLHKVELVYFDGAGRANLTRMLLNAGKVDFTDTRIKQADWPSVKDDPNSLPSKCFGFMPVLKHGEMLIAQSMATAS